MVTAWQNGRGLRGGRACPNPAMDREPRRVGGPPREPPLIGRYRFPN